MYGSPMAQLERARSLSAAGLRLRPRRRPLRGQRHIDGRAAHADGEPVHDARREGRHRARQLRRQHRRARDLARMPKCRSGRGRRRGGRSWRRGRVHAWRAQDAQRTVRDGVFSAAQAARGERAVRIDLHELPRDRGVHGRPAPISRKSTASRSGRRSSTFGPRCPRTSRRR